MRTLYRTLPDIPEKHLVLSLGDGAASNPTSSGVGNEADKTGGVLWEAVVLPVPSSEQLGEMDWTVFPSSGMLLPGQR